MKRPRKRRRLKQYEAVVRGKLYHFTTLYSGARVYYRWPLEKGK